jgi:predicted outer membrane protein
MKWFGFSTAVVVVAFALAGAPVFGQEGRDKPAGERATPPPSVESPQAARADAQGFINDLTIAGLTEVQLGKIATERAASADVKAFGQMMVKDHSQAGDELKKVAAQLTIQPPTQLDQKHKDLVDKLSKLQGPEFDREYINAMVQGHQEVLGKVRARVEAKVPAPGAAAGEHPAGEHPAGEHPAGAGSRDRDIAKTKPPAQNPGAGDTASRGHGEAQLTQWAAKVMPTVQMHLDWARGLQKTVAK